MAEGIRRCLFYTFFVFSLTPNWWIFAQDEAAAEKPLIPINNGAPISVIIARPADVSNASESDFSWFSAFSLEYLFFRMDAVSLFRVVDPETLSVQLHEYGAFNRSPPSRQAYVSLARKNNVSFVLYTEYKAEKKSKTLQLSLALQSIDNNDKRALCSASCDIEKPDEGLDSCMAQLVTGCGIAPESYTAKFLRTKISGSGKCDKLIGTTIIASPKASEATHFKLAEDLKKCAAQEPQSFLAYYAGAREYAKAAKFENAALMLKDLIFRLGPVYPDLYPLASHYFRLAERNENALQMIKVCEGLNLKTDILVLEKALVLEALDDWENAERAYEEVMTIDPGNFHALLFLMRKYNKDHKASDALKLSQLFEAKFPDNGPEYLEKGKSLVMLKQVKAAHAALSKAATLMPDNAEPRVLLGDLSMQSDDFNAALKHYTKAMELSPQNVDVAIKAARANTLSGNPKAALETLKKIAVKFYDNRVVQKEIGLAEFQIGDTAAAKRDLNRFLQNGEPDLNALLVLGRIYEGLREYREALDLYEKTLPLDENKSLAQRRVDAIKAKMGGRALSEDRTRRTSAGGVGFKGSGRLTIRVLTTAVCIGGFIGGYMMNKQIAAAQQDYNSYRGADQIKMAQLHDDLETKQKNNGLLRNVFYGAGALSAIGFSVTFFIK